MATPPLSWRRLPLSAALCWSVMGVVGGSCPGDSRTRFSVLTRHVMPYSAFTGIGYTDQQAQDAVGGILADTYTVDASYVSALPLEGPEVRTTPTISFDVRTQMSLTSDASGLMLQGDVLSPGNSYLY